jgi:glycerophosphoryl diester phosphodiesterase
VPPASASLGHLGGRAVKKILLGVLLVVGFIWLWNSSWRVPPPEGGVQLISHRGVHQLFDRRGLDNETCTAERMLPPTHGYLENTLPSMQAAFAAGADIVEIDVHPTTDGKFAVMHDWTVDCRTEGNGETRGHDMAYLRTLDVGYGYTADGGSSFPFRGTGKGLMPDLEQVLARFPTQRFLVNFKSNEAREGDMLAELLAARPEWRDAVWGAYGGDAPTFRARDRLAGLNVWSRRSLVDCLLQYVGYGWTGAVPTPCRNTKIMVPINAAPWLWGWPNLFLTRARDAGSEVILIGPYEAGDPGTAGIDSMEVLAQVPESFTGYLWTNRIEAIAAPARERFSPP